MLPNGREKAVPVTCSGCGHSVEKALEWLKENPEFCCANCGNLLTSHVPPKPEGASKDAAKR